MKIKIIIELDSEEDEELVEKLIKLMDEEDNHAIST
tara:strand:- start:1016 stop:1123 length:108 start_codon:yes stop_codon:yes gene_type:complete